MLDKTKILEKPRSGFLSEIWSANLRSKLKPIKTMKKIDYPKTLLNVLIDIPCKTTLLWGLWYLQSDTAFHPSWLTCGDVVLTALLLLDKVVFYKDE